ncbi:hypothetical protein ACE1SV_06510 [Streptomyces sp. E-15]
MLVPALEDRGHQVVLALEVSVEGGAADTRMGQEAFQAHSVDALLVEELLGCLQQAVTCASRHAARVVALDAKRYRPIPSLEMVPVGTEIEEGP